MSESGTVTCCMDNSDGLASTLHQLSALNGMGFEVESGKLPLFAKMKNLPLPEATKLAMYHGGDYELVATVKPELVEGLQASLAKRNARLTAIGRVTKSKDCILLTEKGTEVIPDRGWEHFRSSI